MGHPIKLLLGLYYKWGPLVAIVGIVFGVWLALAYVEYLVNSLRRGWRLMRGLSAEGH